MAGQHRRKDSAMLPGSACKGGAIFADSSYCEEMAAGSGMGRGGFLLSANLELFTALIQDWQLRVLPVESCGACGWLHNGSMKQKGDKRWLLSTLSKETKYCISRDWSRRDCLSQRWRRQNVRY